MAKNKRKNKSYRFKNSYKSKNNSTKYTDYSNGNNSSTYNTEDFSERRYRVITFIRNTIKRNINCYIWTVIINAS